MRTSCSRTISSSFAQHFVHNRREMSGSPSTDFAIQQQLESHNLAVYSYLGDAKSARRVIPTKLDTGTINGEKIKSVAFLPNHTTE